MIFSLNTAKYLNLSQAFHLVSQCSVLSDEIKSLPECSSSKLVVNSCIEIVGVVR